MEIIAFLVVGLIAGWLAAQAVSGRGYGLAGDVTVGIVGALAGGSLFRWLGDSVPYGFPGALLTAFAGAVVLLALLRLFHPAR